MAVASPASRLWLVVAPLATALFCLYAALDLREGGRSSSLLTTRLSTPAFYVAHFGGWFFWGSVALNGVLAVASAVLVVGAVARHRTRRAATGGLCATSATLLLGVAVFGCPGCVMPLFGTLGLVLFANTLPLYGLEFKLAAIALTLATIAWTRTMPSVGSRRSQDASPTRGTKRRGGR